MLNKDTILNLKDNNPTKFLESLPYYVAGTTVNKLKWLVGPHNAVEDTLNEFISNQNKTISDVVSSPVNTKRLIVGGTLYIIGRILWDSISNYSNRR